MFKKAVIYARVSTLGQTPDNQLLELRHLAERMGWEVNQIYVDHGISGFKGREERKAFDLLCKDAAHKKFDLIMVWSVDRLGRSLQQLVSFLSEIHAKKIDLYIHQQGIDTTTPGGKAMFQLCGVFAEFERALIRERVLAGLTRAKANGKKLGRPTVSKAVEQAVYDLRASGKGIKAIAKQLHIGVSTVQRLTKTQPANLSSAH